MEINALKKFTEKSDAFKILHVIIIYGSWFLGGFFSRNFSKLQVGYDWQAQQKPYS